MGRFDNFFKPQRECPEAVNMNAPQEDLATSLYEGRVYEGLVKDNGLGDHEKKLTETAEEIFGKAFRSLSDHEKKLVEQEAAEGSVICETPTKDSYRCLGSEGNLRLVSEAKNVLVESGARVIPGAWKLAHKDGMVNVWWYNIADKKLHLSKTGDHFSEEFKDLGLKSGHDQRGWVRGRVGKIGDAYFLFFYNGPEFFDSLPGDVLTDIYTKVSELTDKPISYVVDHDGYDMMGHYGEGDAIESKVNEVSFTSLDSVLAKVKDLTAEELITAVKLSLTAELDATELYKRIASATDNEMARKVMQSVADEESVHAGEFRKLLATLDPKEEEKQKEGEAEAGALGGDKEEAPVEEAKKPLREERAYEEQETWEEIVDLAKDQYKKGMRSFKAVVDSVLDVPEYKKFIQKWYPGNDFDLRQELEGIVMDELDENCNESDMGNEDEKIKKLVSQAHDYFSRIGISPDQEEIVDFVIGAVAEETGLNYEDVASGVRKRMEELDEAKVPKEPKIDNTPQEQEGVPVDVAAQETAKEQKKDPESTDPLESQPKQEGDSVEAETKETEVAKSQEEFTGAVEPVDVEVKKEKEKKNESKVNEELSKQSYQIASGASAEDILSGINDAVANLFGGSVREVKTGVPELRAVVVTRESLNEVEAQEIYDTVVNESKKAQVNEDVVVAGDGFSKPPKEEVPAVVPEEKKEEPAVPGEEQKEVAKTLFLGSKTDKFYYIDQVGSVVTDAEGKEVGKRAEGQEVVPFIQQMISELELDSLGVQTFDAFIAPPVEQEIEKEEAGEEKEVEKEAEVQGEENKEEAKPAEAEPVFKPEEEKPLA